MTSSKVRTAFHSSYGNNADNKKKNLQPLVISLRYAKIVHKGWIVVSESIPIDLPVVRGLITSELQTPLCHVALLCSNRLTPNMALKNAHQSLKHLEGKIVKMVVKQTEWTVTEATKEEESKWLARKRAQEKESRRNIPLDCNLGSLTSLLFFPRRCQVSDLRRLLRFFFFFFVQMTLVSLTLV
jgi:hypothetical protein